MALSPDGTPAWFDQLPVFRPQPTRLVVIIDFRNALRRALAKPALRSRLAAYGLDASAARLFVGCL